MMTCGDPAAGNVDVELLVATDVLPVPGVTETGVPKSAPSTLNWTLPVGLVVPLAGVTVAVKVTGRPNVAGLADEATVVVVLTVAT